MGTTPFQYTYRPHCLQPAEPAPPAPASLPPPLPNMPPPPPTVVPSCTPPPAPHHPLSMSQAPASPSTPPLHSPSPTHSPSLPHELLTASSVPAPSSQTRATSEDVNMDLASSPAAAAPIVMVQEPTLCSNTALANLSHTLAQLQVPPPWMTRAQSATPTETLRQSTRLTSRTPALDDSKAAKRKATSSAVTNTKHLKK
ncbi:hypothetical protein BDN71DRAFT_1507533 [Pleurotus eryngii]|uniref:Uncharacterized protein n=1 Tax=Pleurotus eryngii TaxID=5323 RepID=A0A9P5ZWP8_PLEER|nr:hypothetical protein BDN71DRAFT_1507533 [Pleurotus eryngii]